MGDLYQPSREKDAEEEGEGDESLAGALVRDLLSGALRVLQGLRVPVRLRRLPALRAPRPQPRQLHLLCRHLWRLLRSVHFALPRLLPGRGGLRLLLVVHCRQPLHDPEHLWHQEHQVRGLHDLHLRQRARWVAPGGGLLLLGLIGVLPVSAARRDGVPEQEARAPRSRDDEDVSTIVSSSPPSSPSPSFTTYHHLSSSPSPSPSSFNRRRSSHLCVRIDLHLPP